MPFAVAEPDARLFPLYQPPTLLQREEAGQYTVGAELSVADADSGTLVAPSWIRAAAEALDTDNRTAGETIFYALTAVMHAPRWLTLQPTELDDFPTIPLPGEPHELAAAATLGPASPY
ncbi:MAG: hypothetical protein ACR2F6_17095 [Mycobacteriales bacterium]